MSLPHVNGEITDPVMVQIVGHADAILALLPFLQNLTPTERRKIRKKATKRAGYVNDVYNAVIANPSAIPAVFQVSEFTRVRTLEEKLTLIRQRSLSFNEAIDDTLMLVGNELMKLSDTCYDYLKRAAENDSALTEVVNRIGTAFEGQGRKKKTIPPAG